MGEIVLVCPENRDSRRLVEALDRTRCGVRCIPNAEDALVYLRTTPADLVIAEQDMTPLSGLDFFRRLQSGDGRKAPPFVLMADVSRSEEAGRALKLGALDFLPRPVSDNEAFSIVQGALEESSRPWDGDGGIGFEADDGILIVRFPAEVGQPDIRQLTQLLRDEFVPPERGLVIDLERTRYICSSGVGTLHVMAEACANVAPNLYVAGASARIRRLLELAGVFHYYRNAESVYDAVADI